LKFLDILTDFVVFFNKKPREVVMSYRIVVADKDPRSREAVTRFLLSEDNEFVSVSNSGELKEAIKTQKPDLIILNTVLADAPGWKLVQRIKGSKEYSDVPVLLMTGDPGSPPPAQIQATGADKYLSKPIDGRALKETVQSLLGIGTGAEEGVSEEIMIDFADEDSGDMTEELLQMSNVALQHDEPSTDVGDTVEIDTGTLVAELDHPGELAGEDTYEDTVRLNLEDMGLEDELDDGSSFEPTIELISDIPSETPSAELRDAVELQLEAEEPLPDFSAAAVLGSEGLGKDSITVDMDVEDLSLELDLDESEDRTQSMRVETIDVDDTEIGQILEVQEPSKVLTSEDLFLDDESLVKDTVSDTPTTGIEVIDLEEDAELREIDLEELEPVQEGQETGVGLDLDETVPVEGMDMEQLANEDLGESILDEEEVSLELESPLDAASGYESPEELTLEEVSEEEITTQEFFGEELPTEEFPAEKFPEDKTRDLGIEQEISLDDVAFRDQFGPEGEPVTADIPVDEITLDTASAEEILFQEAREDEPILEVTEDISFDEITLQEIDEAGLRGAGMAAQEPKPVPQPAGPVSVPPPFAAPLSGFAAQPPPAPAFAEKPAPPIPEPPKQPPAAPAPQPPQQQPGPVAAMGGGVSAQEIAGIVSSSLGSLFSQAMPGRSQLADTVDTALRGSLPTKHELSDTYGQALEANLPSKQEVLQTLSKEMSALLPSRAEVFARVDELAAAAIPSGEVINRKLDEAISRALSPDALSERLQAAIRGMPLTEEATKRISEALEALPSADVINLRLDQALQGIPSQQDIRSRIDQALDALPSADVLRERIDEALRDLPGREEVEAKVDAALALITTDKVMSRVESALSAIPTQQVVMDRVDRSLSGLPSAETILSRLEERLASMLPDKETISATMHEMISDRISSALLETGLRETILEMLPTTEAILETMRGALPERDRVQEAISQSLTVAIENSLPERVWLETVSRGLFDERTRGSLPRKDEIVTLLREEIRGKLLDTVEKSIKEQIEKITAELAS
jgi:DNA-binding response OmpR family regulator